MFSIFRRSTSNTLHGETALAQKPVVDWCPTRTARAAKALFTQLHATGFFLGALNMRHGFEMRTLPDGLETGTNSGLKASVDVGETEVILRFAGVDPARVALMSLGTALAESLEDTINWDIQKDGTQQRICAEIALEQPKSVLRIVARSGAVDTMGTGQELDGTIVTLQVVRIN